MEREKKDVGEKENEGSYQARTDYLPTYFYLCTMYIGTCLPVSSPQKGTCSLSTCIYLAGRNELKSYQNLTTYRT